MVKQPQGRIRRAFCPIRGVRTSPAAATSNFAIVLEFSHGVHRPTIVLAVFLNWATRPPDALDRRPTTAPISVRNCWPCCQKNHKQESVKRGDVCGLVTGQLVNRQRTL